MAITVTYARGSKTDYLEEYEPHFIEEFHDAGNSGYLNVDGGLSAYLVMSANNNIKALIVQPYHKI